MRIRVFAIFLLLCAMASAQSVYIKNVTLIDPAQRRATLVPAVFIHGKGIEVLPKKHMAPPNARVLDGTGKFLIPGLKDVHTHIAGVSAKPAWAEDLLKIYLAYGITSIRDMGGDARTLRQLQREQLLRRFGPRLIFSGPFLDGSAEGYGSKEEVIEVKDAAGVEAATEKLSKEGTDFIKTGSRLSPEAFRAIAATHEIFAGHVPDAVSVEEAVDLGMASMEHLFGIQLAVTGKEAEFRRRAAELRAKQDREGLAKLNDEIYATYDAKAAKALFEKMKRRGTVIVPTLVWTKSAHTLAELASDTSQLKYLPKEAREAWTPEKAEKLFSPRGIAFYKRKFENDMKLVRLMKEAGVDVRAGSDSLDPYVFPGESLHRELELLVEAGFSNMEALDAAMKPALIALEGGKQSPQSSYDECQGDTVLLDANPAADIRNARKISAVTIGGRLMTRDDLNKLLAEVEKKWQ